jgi:hypothetical protein
MEHIKSSFYFKGKEGEWRVDYVKPMIYEGRYSNDYSVIVYLDNKQEYYWKAPPYTRCKNPTKTQAKEVITESKKLKNKRVRLNEVTTGHTSGQV